MTKQEKIFFQVLSDIKEFLENLILVGGWVPYIYAKFLWKGISKMPLATADIDLGVSAMTKKFPSKSIYQKLSSKYGEHHISMDRLFPVVLHLENVEIHFISSEDLPKEIAHKLVGRQINIDKVEHFDILLNNRITVDVIDNKTNRYRLHIPTPAAFIYHKGLTFTDRQFDDAKAKDLHYIYYILRFCLNPNELISDLIKFKKHKSFSNFKANLTKYFQRISSQGCIMVERENGPDEYIDDLRQDIFERFVQLREALEK